LWCIASWHRWSSIFLLAVAFFAVGCASYMLGVTHESFADYGAMEVYAGSSENTLLCSAECAVLDIDQDIDSVLPADIVQNSQALDRSQCLYVGSKNGTKFYPPDCTAVKRIKPENLICFFSQEDAQSQGYGKTKSCKF